MRKWLAISALILLAFAAVAGGGYYTWLHTPPPIPLTVDDAIALIQSPRFRRLSDAEREPYILRMRDLESTMTPEQKLQGMEMMRKDPELRAEVQKLQGQVMAVRMHEFINAEPEKRKQMLDEDIVKMEAGMAAMGRRGPGNGGAAGTAKGGGADQRREERMKSIQNRIENGDPQDQAYVGEYFKALIERRRELGMPDFPTRPR